MKTVISVGKQDFQSLRENGYFYVDKTEFIKEWWEAGDDVTLITRPHQFGKTLNMSMLECFFSLKYKERSDLFEGLNIWKEEKYRKLQGTYPVIFLSFASIKVSNPIDAKKRIKMQIAYLYEAHRFLLEGNVLNESEKEQFQEIVNMPEDVFVTNALNRLCMFLERYYNKKVIILLDDHDMPMKDAYRGGYWNELAEFMHSMFNTTFKENPYLERAIITGITGIHKESIFSDLNHVKEITTTSELYGTCFGFTESEVFTALDDFALSERKQNVKKCYQGFNFGVHKDIYNPWSITNFLNENELKAYWVNSNSNSLIDILLKTSPSEIKKKMELLLKGETIYLAIDEQIVFKQLNETEGAIWSFMLACGYLKVNDVQYRNEYGEMLDEPLYSLSIANKEIMIMFDKIVSDWFGAVDYEYNGFINALLKGNVKEMNAYMSDVVFEMFSSFEKVTAFGLVERNVCASFYHALVLGLLVELRGRYEVVSNDESGYGRYDVMLCPLKENELAIVLEFKIREASEEKTLKDTVNAALLQIEEKQYDVRLSERGIKMEDIRHYGVAFDGENVLIG